MTIRFSAALRATHALVGRTMGPRFPVRPANDNGRAEHDERLISATLRHFAGHGLSAARRACENAEAALRAGREEECRYWLSICRLLDRRMADSLSARVEQKAL
jgi:hypothetical protein